MRALLALSLVALSGCLGLPPPAPVGTRAHGGDPVPDVRLARTGETPGTTSIAELTSAGTTVLVFYRGDW